MMQSDQDKNRTRLFASVILSLLLMAPVLQAAVHAYSSDSVSLITPCVNGLTADINGGAFPGIHVTSIEWNWGDGGPVVVHYFAFSHTYLAGGTYQVTVTANFDDGSTASASTIVNVGIGDLANCEALTISAGTGGSVSYSASVGSGSVPAGGSRTLYVAYLNGASLTAIPSGGESFGFWVPTGSITTRGSLADPVISVTSSGQSGIDAVFIVVQASTDNGFISGDTSHTFQYTVATDNSFVALVAAAGFWRMTGPPTIPAPCHQLAFITDRDGYESSYTAVCPQQSAGTYSVDVTLYAQGTMSFAAYVFPPGQYSYVSGGATTGDESVGSLSLSFASMEFFAYAAGNGNDEFSTSFTADTAGQFASVGRDDSSATVQSYLPGIFNGILGDITLAGIGVSLLTSPPMAGTSVTSPSDGAVLHTDFDLAVKSISGIATVADISPRSSTSVGVQVSYSNSGGAADGTLTLTDNGNPVPGGTLSLSNFQGSASTTFTVSPGTGGHTLVVTLSLINVGGSSTASSSIGVAVSSTVSSISSLSFTVTSSPSYAVTYTGKLMDMVVSGGAVMGSGFLADSCDCTSSTAATQSYSSLALSTSVSAGKELFLGESMSVLVNALGSYTITISVTANGYTHTASVLEQSASPPPAMALTCGQAITSSVTLTADIGPCSGDGIDIRGNNVVFDCAGHTISGTGTIFSKGINVDGGAVYPNGLSGVVVENCQVTGFYYDLGADLTTQSLFMNNVLSSAPGYPVFLGQDQGDAFIGNQAYGSSGFLMQSTINSVFIGNSVVGAGYNGFSVVSGSSGNLFVGNTADNNGVFGFYDTSVGSGTGGTADAYQGNVCANNFSGDSDPTGLCGP